MPKFTFTCELKDKETITLQTEANNLKDLLISLENFLKGSGYTIEGTLSITKETLSTNLDHIFLDPLNSIPSFHINTSVDTYVPRI